MKHILTNIVLVAWLAQSAVAGSGDGVRVYAVVNAETAIYPGDAFQYSIVVEGGAKPSKIDITPLAPFNPHPAGDGTSYQQFNDRVTISYSSNYQITAGEAGTMHLPGVTVVVNDRTYTTNAVDVTVSKPGTTDRMNVEMTVAERKCYVGQPVVMSVRWIVSARWQNVAFDVPVFKSSDLLIEEVSSPDGATGEQSLIDNVPTAVRGSRQRISGMEAEVFAFEKVLIPQRAGRLRLDPITVSANIATGRVRTNSLFNPYALKFERVSVQSDAVELEVLPLPAADKPAEFYGLLGRYTISASAAPTKVSVGDPITLTVRIGGNPYLKPVQWPQLEHLPELAAGFKIPAERASPVLEDGAKVFTQTLRANSDAVTQIPPIPLAYFDSQQGRYVVARTDPIPLEVAPTKILTNADVEGSGLASANGAGATRASPVQAIRKGLSANYYGPGVLVDQRFSLLPAIVSPGYAAIWGIPLAGLVASAAVRIARRTSPESLARKRRRQAAVLAGRQLKTLAAAEARARPELLGAALKGYVGDRFDRVAASLTADDCRRAIEEVANDSTLATRYGTLVAACEAAQYAPLEAEIGASQAQEATELIDAIERRLKK